MSLGTDYEGFLERIETGLSKTVDLTKVPDWIIKNTRHPANKNLRWNFHEHEFQLGIVSDASPWVVVRKCSQVGLSEIAVRLTLAICYMRDFTGMYVLPTRGFARKFSIDRVDKVVDNAPVLRDRKNRDAYSVFLKQIGDMTLYLCGSYSDDDAISVPAQFLVRDEYDFCKQSVLSKFDSRLGHNKEGEDFRRDFSTPTVAGFGIDNKFNDGSQQFYAVRHDACGKWVVPEFLNDVRIPGLEGTARDLEKYHLQDDSIRINEAFICCPGCRRPINPANMADPSKRMWVGKRENRDISSYQVQPFDVITINPVARTLKQLSGYALKKDWVNFKVGDVYEDDASSFNPTMIERYHKAQYLLWQEGERLRTGIRFGVDVGAISYILGGMPGPMGRMIVVYAEAVLCRGQEDALFKRVCVLADTLGFGMGVIDAMPDFNTSSKLCLRYPNKFLACEYTESMPSPLMTLAVHEERKVVKAHRDKRFDLLARDYSNGTIEWALTDGQEKEAIKRHVQGMKKVRQMSEDAADMGDDMPEHWEKIGGDDHYLHALNYLHIANELQGTVGITDEKPPCLPMPGRTRVGRKGLEQEEAKTEQQRRSVVMHVSNGRMRK